MDEEIKMRIGMDATPMARAMRDSQQQAADFGRSVEKGFANIGTRIKDSLLSIGPAIAGAFSAAAASRALASITDYAGRVQDVADISRASTDFVQGFSSAIAQNGGSAEAAEKALEKLGTTISQARNGTKEAIALFDKYSISLNTASGEAKGTDEIVRAISERMKEASANGTDAAIAADFWGDKLGGKLTPALRDGSIALQDFIDKAAKLSSEDLKAIDDLGDAYAEMARQAKVEGGVVVGFWAQMGEKIREATGGMVQFKNVIPAMQVIADAKAIGRLSVRGDTSAPPTELSEDSPATPQAHGPTSPASMLSTLKELDQVNDRIRQKGLSNKQKLIELDRELLRLKKEGAGLEAGSLAFVENMLAKTKAFEQLLAIASTVKKESAISQPLNYLDPRYMSPKDSRRLPLGYGVLGGGELGRGFLGGVFPSDPAPQQNRQEQAMARIVELAESGGFQVTVKAVDE